MRSTIKKVLLMLFCVLLSIGLWITFDIWSGSTEVHAIPEKIEEQW